MPEDKKSQQKGRSDAKDQRRPRQGRQKAGPVEKNVPLVEKRVEDSKAPQKPVYEEPGPEFYKNLKRETDDILKITEEANSKYKKKEIQSNWTKYEMPIETYEEIEQENLGADYEQLIQMPLSVGGHFQFKHEKSWDIGTAPSLYDKYFDINMNDLANALCTIPFYDRNNINKDIFNQTDIMTMENRATRYKQKYYNYKSYTTAELEAQDKILSHLKDQSSKSEPDGQIDKKEIDLVENEKRSVDKILEEKIPPIENDPNELRSKEADVEITGQINKKEISFIENEKMPDDKIMEEKILPVESCSAELKSKEAEVEITFKTTKIIKEERSRSAVPNTEVDIDLDGIDDLLSKSAENDVQKVEFATERRTLADEEVIPLSKPEKSKNAVIESPEDLEKWLDDFLDS